MKNYLDKNGRKDNNRNDAYWIEDLYLTEVDNNRARYTMKVTESTIYIKNGRDFKKLLKIKKLIEEIKKSN